MSHGAIEFQASSSSVQRLDGASHQIEVSEPFDGYHLPGRFLLSNAGSDCRMLAIHGARSNHMRLNPLLTPLQAAGVGSLSFSLSGHSDGSPLKIGQTSLNRNLMEANRFARSIVPPLKTVFGHSLGGALAMKVAEVCADTVSTIILSCTALYPEAAYAEPNFGENFRTTISRPFGFLDSKSLLFLKRFTGKVMLIVGEYDGLRAELHGGIPGRSAGYVEATGTDSCLRQVYSPIPAEVFEVIRQAAGSNLTSIVLDECDHRVFPHLSRFPVVANTLARLLASQLGQGQPSGNYQIRTDGTYVHPD